jgi:hypothetical protein
VIVTVADSGDCCNSRIWRLLPQLNLIIDVIVEFCDCNSS